MGPGSECSMGPLSNEFRKVRRRRTRAPEAHPPRRVRGHAPPGKFLKVRLLESLWSLFPLLDSNLKEVKCPCVLAPCEEIPCDLIKCFRLLSSNLQPKCQ